MNNIKNAIFHTQGTNINSYIKRYLNNYIKHKTFIKNKLSIHDIEVLDQNDNLIDKFSSESTWNQFINSMLAFGFIEPSIGKYIIKIKKINIDFITKNIFSKSSNKKIDLLRQSRLISFLVLIGKINENNFNDLNIKGKMSKTNFKNIKKEISLWEIKISKNEKTLKNVLERIENYEFKKQ